MAKQRIGGMVINMDTREIRSKTNGLSYEHLGMAIQFDESDVYDTNMYNRMKNGEDIGMQAVTIDMWASDAFINSARKISVGEWVIIDCDPVMDGAGHVRWNISAIKASATEPFYCAPVIQAASGRDLDIEEDE